jgi:hypothetical protein
MYKFEFSEICMFIFVMFYTEHQQGGEKGWMQKGGGGACEVDKYLCYARNNKSTLLYANISIIVVREVRVVT